MYDLDLFIFNVLHDLAGHTSWLDWFIIIIAEYLPYTVVITIILVAYRQYNKRKSRKSFDYIIALVSGAIAGSIARFIHLFYHHSRPFVSLTLTPLFPEVSYSFPSGHAIFFFAIATSIYMINKKFGLVLFVISIFIGLARIIAGVHWPSDILAGAVLGIITGYIVMKIYRCYKPTIYIRSNL